MKLPPELFCKIVEDDAPWLSAEASMENCVGDDTGPLKVGVYRLVETRLVKRKLEVLTRKKGE
jgi:hypothetical protein